MNLTLKNFTLCRLEPVGETMEKGRAYLPTLTLATRGQDIVLASC